MLKFRDIGTYKNAVNFGYFTADVVLHNGNVVTVDKAAKKVALPATGKETDLAIVMNIIDKPEIETPNDYKIEIGENPRVFMLYSLKGRIIDMDMDQVDGTYADIAEGNVLVPDTTGKFKVATDATGYTEYLKVTEKTGFNGEGIAVEVIA